MIRLVLDTNILVSAVLRSEGNEAAVLDLVVEGQVRPCVSPAILAEYESVLKRPRLRLEPRAVRRMLKAVISVALIVEPEMAVHASPDDADNRFLECAEAAGADFLVTGNRRHFPSH